MSDKNSKSGLSFDQQTALHECTSFTGPVHVLTGFAGCGKTYLIDAITSTYRARGISCQVVGPTHKSCSVLRAKLNETIPTWQKLLGYVLKKSDTGEMTLQKMRPAQLEVGGILIVDESSMLNHTFLKYILDAARVTGCQVLFVGDPHQILPVKGVNCPALNFAARSELRVQHRQAEGSQIIGVAHSFRTVLEGELFPLNEAIQEHQKEVQYIQNREEFYSICDRVFLENKNKTDHAKVLFYANKFVIEHAGHLHKLLTGHTDSYPRVGEIRVVNEAVLDSRDQLLFGTDEQVKILDVSPAQAGEIAGFDVVIQGMLISISGLVTGISPPEKVFIAHDWVQANRAIKDLQKIGNQHNKIFKQTPSEENKEAKNRAWRDYYALKNTLVDLRLPYCCTVHKSQGSTFNTVFIDLNEIGMCTQPELVARLLYVAISRASHKVYLTGELPERLSRHNVEVDF